MKKNHADSQLMGGNYWCVGHHQVIFDFRSFSGELLFIFIDIVLVLVLQLQYNRYHFTTIFEPTVFLVNSLANLESWIFT